MTCVARPERAVDACSGGSVCVWQARGSCVPAPHAAQKLPAGRAGQVKKRLCSGHVPGRLHL